MSISSLGGLILDKAVSKFSGIAVFQPLFNGVGGNLVAVQASRISTYLHLNVRTLIDKLSIILGRRQQMKTTNARK